MKKANYEGNVKWNLDNDCGTCQLTGNRTQWIATTKFGSIRCSIDYKPFGAPLDLIVWNRILTNSIEEWDKKIKESEAK